MIPLVTRLALALVLALPAFLARAEPAVEDPWIREAPPGRDVTAAYLRIHNPDAEDLTLVAAASPAASRVELHEHRQENGMMRMRQVERVVVPAGETVAFAPGGLHLMLFGWDGSPAGSRVPLTMITGSGETLELEATVRRGGP
jgi:copper(I)-binding protein